MELDTLPLKGPAPARCRVSKGTLFCCACLAFLSLVGFIATRKDSCDILPKTGDHGNVSDYEWVNVFHIAPYCFGGEEGLGMRLLFPNRSYGPYGCWFAKVAPSPDTARVNVRRVLTRSTRMSMAVALGQPCEGGQCYAQSGDNFWCEAAVALGYDSLYIRHSHHMPGRPEIVLCYGGCMTQNLRNSACVPVDTRSQDLFPCICNNSTEVLLCNNNLKKCNDFCFQ